MKPPSTSSSSNISPHTIQASRINPLPMSANERGSLQEVASMKLTDVLEALSNGAVLYSLSR